MRYLDKFHYIYKYLGTTRFFKYIYKSICMGDSHLLISKSAQFTSQALFGILMLALFVWILVYGYNAVIGAQNDISDEKLESLRQSIEQRTSVCSEQSQRGRLETIAIDPAQITHVCYLSNTSSLTSNFIQMAKERGLTQNHTIFLLNGPQDVDFYNIDYSNPQEAQETVNQFQIYDIITLEEGATLSSISNECQIRDSRQFEFRFQC